MKYRLKSRKISENKRISVENRQPSPAKLEETFAKWAALQTKSKKTSDTENQRREFQNAAAISLTMYAKAFFRSNEKQDLDRLSLSGAIHLARRKD